MSSRRRAIQALGATALSPLSGCLFDAAGYLGVNKRLEIINNYAESVELHIVVERNEPAGSQNREQVFEGDVSLPERTTKSLEVLGDHQFRITVTGLDQEMSLWTRPICDGAKTAIIIDNNGELQHEVRSCE